jgi:hypothetical protein
MIGAMRKEMEIYVSEILEDRYPENQEEPRGIVYSTVFLLFQKNGVY